MNLARTFLVLSALFVALLASAPAEAGNRGHHRRWRDGHHQPRPTPPRHNRGVPELDGSSAASAAVLLGAGVFVILGRRRRLPR